MTEGGDSGAAEGPAARSRSPSLPMYDSSSEHDAVEVNVNTQVANEGDSILPTDGAEFPINDDQNSGAGDGSGAT